MTGVGFQNFALNGKDKVVLSLDNIGNMNSKKYCKYCTRYMNKINYE